MSSGARVNRWRVKKPTPADPTPADPTPAQAALLLKVKAAAQEAFARQQGLKQSKAAAEAKKLKEAKLAWNGSSDKTYVGATTWSLPLEEPKAPAKAPAPAPAKAQPKDQPKAPAESDQGWTKVGPNGKPIGTKKYKKKPKAQSNGAPKGAPKKRRPLPDFIASLKRQIKVLNERKAKAERDGNHSRAEDLQRQINRLWGMMKRAEERLRQSGCRRWNAQQRRTGTLANFIVLK